MVASPSLQPTKQGLKQSGGGMGQQGPQHTLFAWLLRGSRPTTPADVMEQKLVMVKGANPHNHWTCSLNVVVNSLAALVYFMSIGKTPGI
jgi:hypothetical protein